MPLPALGNGDRRGRSARRIRGAWARPALGIRPSRTNRPRWSALKPLSRAASRNVSRASCSASRAPSSASAARSYARAAAGTYGRSVAARARQQAERSPRASTTPCHRTRANVIRGCMASHARERHRAEQYFCGLPLRRGSKGFPHPARAQIAPEGNVATLGGGVAETGSGQASDCEGSLTPTPSDAPRGLRDPGDSPSNPVGLGPAPAPTRAPCQADRAALAPRTCPGPAGS